MAFQKEIYLVRIDLNRIRKRVYVWKKREPRERGVKEEAGGEEMEKRIDNFAGGWFEKANGGAEEGKRGRGEDREKRIWKV